MRKRGYNRKKTLVIGTGEIAGEFLMATKQYPDWKFDIVGFLTDKPQEAGRMIYETPVIGDYSDLIKILHERVIDEVVIALSSKELNKACDIIALCEQEGVQVRLISDFFRTMIAKLYLHDIHGMPILTFSTVPMKEWKQFIKRSVDIVISAVMLLILSPLLLLIAMLIKITSPGPVFYEWNVVGFNKKPFRSYKFRSMVKDADKLKEKLFEQNEMNGPVFKMKRDPRVTTMGYFLRKFSLDELPQLWSVLNGDMSLVGPRPCFQKELANFESWQRRKLSVKPGLTCLWQTNGRNDINDFNEWVKMDLEYIDNWSLWLDFKILFKTIPAVLSGKGAS